MKRAKKYQVANLIPGSCFAYSSALKMEATCSSIQFHRTTRCYILEFFITTTVEPSTPTTILSLYTLNPPYSSYS
jgi:hypothetical protein